MTVDLHTCGDHGVVDVFVMGPAWRCNDIRDPVKLLIDQLHAAEAGVYTASGYAADNVVLIKAGGVNLVIGCLHLPRDPSRANVIDNDLLLGVVVIQRVVSAFDLIRNGKSVEDDLVAGDCGLFVSKG